MRALAFILAALLSTGLAVHSVVHEDRFMRRESAPPNHPRALLSARSTPDQVTHYCKNIDVFGNKMDVPVASHFYRTFIENQQHSVFFLVGVNDGTDVKGMLDQPWWDRTKAAIYGWEILRENFDSAIKKTLGHKEVEIFREGVSDKIETVHLSGSGGTAGIYPSGSYSKNKKYGFSDAHEEVKTGRWEDFVKSHGIPEVSYALIDVEGHEMPVVHGMDLEKLKTTFPVFQYELGGTWVDGRHAGNMTQEDAARYLESIGYSLFLMGVDAHGKPVLAQMTPEAFTAATCVEEGGKTFVQGNALAVLMEELPKKPWLKSLISEMIERDSGI